MSKTTTKAASALIVIVLMLSASFLAPIAFAELQQTQTPQIAWVVNDPYYKEAWVTVDVNGTESFLISARVNGDRIEVESINGVETHTNYVEPLVSLPRPPYPWWVSIGDVPAFHIFLDGPTATNIAVALAVLTFLLGVHVDC